ncbi:uncharacterized protein LOC143879071 [Tasmannia lanceolata]|uniref:uncharacterized protein LOC143879071 n=1 Tax=Tasmannia lanceolata TaxID=3420 RepID=UPI0040640C50
MIKIGSWNTRGLCSTSKREAAKNLISSEKLHVICLLETKARPNFFKEYIDTICPNWNHCANYAHVAKGRIWVSWNPSTISFTLMGDSDQYIHGTITHLQSKESFLLSAIYARNYGGERKALWEALRSLRSSSQPWLLVGDFNVTRFHSERLGGAPPNIEDMNAFNDCIDDCSLLDLKTVGQALSWSNCSKSGDIKLRRLDRALVNGFWIQKFPNSLGIYKYPNISNHSPIIVQTQESPPLDAKPFRFLNACLEDSSLFEIVERSWQSETFGNPMFRLVSKLKKTKEDLKKWNKESFGRVNLQLPIVRQKLEDIQKIISIDLQNLALRREESVLKDQFLLTARREEEEIARQKSRISWLNSGDTNSSFFHAAISSRRNINCIQATALPNGEITSNQAEVNQIFVSHFQSILNSNHPDPSLESIPDPSNCLSQTQAENLCPQFPVKKLKWLSKQLMETRALGLMVLMESFSKPSGFKNSWCRWVTECISTPVFSVLINGSPKGFFPSSNGLRQGDPLSPLLFCIHMEMLTCILNEAILSKTISTPFSKRDIHISHLLFADDVVIFANASQNVAQSLVNCLDRFSYCSGLSLNRQKSEVFFNNSNNFQKELICYILGIPTGSFPIRYLGLPLITSRLSTKDCSPLVSKIRKRLAAWNNLTLSRAGRIELIKSVLTSFQVYWSAAFNVPIQILEEIEKIFKKFIWSGSNQTKNIHLIAWDNLCKPKAEGGVGIRHLRDINQVGQMKQFWALASGKPSLWKDWISCKYIRSRNLWTIPMPSSPSWGFRGILQTREKMKKLVCYAIGDGKGIDFWKQPWHPNGAISDLVSAGSFNIHPKNVQVSQLYFGNSWHPHLQDLKEIISTAIITPGSLNMAVWKPSSSGEFDSKSAWNSIRKKSPLINWAPSIWFPGHVPKFASTAWLALHGRLTTRDRLGFLGPNRDLKCPLCHTVHESIDHIFFRCSYSRWVWNSVLWRFNLRKNPKRSLLLEEEWLRSYSRGKGQSATALRLAFQSAIFFLWIERNKRVHDQKETHKQSVLKHILHSKKPDPGWSKLNSDASLTDSEGSIGGIIRDHTGTTTSLFSSQTAKSEINIMELQAINRGLELAKSKNIGKIWVESDSLSAVETISKESKCPWKAIMLLDRIETLLSTFNNWKITHLWREGNQPADFLSKTDCICKGDDIQVQDIPPQLLVLIARDSTGAPHYRL